jgi:L-alanine-DL-glutamate epimerase-like enolase superfamily enzyme
VISGIESALLDLKGKALGVPAYELLGGRCHESLPCYATGGPSPEAEDDLIAKIAHYQSLGFRAVKVGAGSWSAENNFRIASSAAAASACELRKFEVLKREFGDEVSLALDGHMDNLPEHCPPWNESVAASVLNSLENCNILFFEEPLPYTDAAAYARLRSRSAVAVAGGECLTSLEEWRDWMAKNPFDLPQLDASFMGGPTVFVKIARLCELKGLSIATHAWSAAPGVAANLHAAFACRNAKLLEWPPYNSPLHTDLWVEPPVLRDGLLSVSDAPGLGIRLPPDLAEKYPYRPGTGEFNDVKGKVLTT